MNALSAIVRRHWPLIAFIASLILFLWLVWTCISVVLPFLVGFLIAYLLLPLVRWLEKHLPGGRKHPRRKRISIIAAVYFVALIVVAGAAFYMFTVMSSTVALLWLTLPQIISGVVAWVQGFMAAVRLEVPASLLQQYDQTIASAGVGIVDALRNGLGQGFSFVTGSASLILGFLSLPLVVFFMLKDWDSLRDSFFGFMPTWVREHVVSAASIVEKVMGRYVRGLIFMSIIIGAMVFIMLEALRIEFAPVLALWAAMMEFIPLLGVWLSILAGVTIALATDPGKALWVVLGYVIIQQIENNVLVPRIQGTVMKMNPIFIILVSVVGAFLAGLAGFIVAVPIAATIIEFLKYFRLSIRQKRPGVAVMKI